MSADWFNELNRDFSSNRGDKIDCVNCNQSFIRGCYCFYNLCDTCCDQFKNYGRDKNGYPTVTNLSVSAWVKINKENSGNI